MISVAEAVQRITAVFAPLETESMPLGQALHRVLAEDIRARLDQPPSPVSAMDGYAVRAGDAASVPATLRVIGDAPAGHPFDGKLGKGDAVRIFTGGVVPEGADAIVIQEDTSRDGNIVTVREAAQSGRHIRKKGLDFAHGDVLARAGRKLRARDLALLAAGDIPTVPVRRRPRVALAATGDELSPPGTPHKPGGIVASSGYGLSGMIDAWGADVIDLGILPDTAEALAALPARSKGADVIVTMGGASVGDHDLVRTALEPHGFVLDFWKIAMRPGKPLIFGRLGATPFLGLPGNPVSSFVCAILFLKPALAAMLGQTTKNALRTARLTHELPTNDSRQDYLRAALLFRDDEWWAEPFAVQDSSMQSAFAAADCLVVRAPRAAAAQTGDRVDILPLDDI
jgi:molybdopterin molybdotransferase